MYFYFAADYPSAIKINGIYYGKLSSAVKPLRIDEGCPLIEICPLLLGESAVNFILDEQFLSNPPDGILLTNLKGGYLIKFLRRFYDGEFSVVCQQKYDDCIATVFKENGLKLSIETREDFFAQTYKLDATDAEIIRFSLDNIPFLAVCIENQSIKTLFVYKLSGKIQNLMCRQVDGFTAKNNELTTTERFKDIAKHTVITEWVFDEQLKAKNNSVKVSENFSLENLNEKLIPYAFLEAFLVDGEWKEYLSDSIKEHADKLKDYLGEYIGVMPPPTFRNQNEVGVIYREKDSLYTVEYFTFESADKKINNINKI